MRKVRFVVLALLCAFACVAALAQTEPAAQEKAAKPAAAKQARWEGTVQLVNKDNSTLTVKHVRTGIQKTIHYDSATKWVSQEHGSKKVNNIDPGDVKEGDRVICVGKEENKEFLATLISKRLTPLR